MVGPSPLFSATANISHSVEGGRGGDHPLLSSAGNEIIASLFSFLRLGLLAVVSYPASVVRRRPRIEEGPLPLASSSPPPFSQRREAKGEREGGEGRSLIKWLQQLLLLLHLNRWPSSSSSELLLNRSLRTNADGSSRCHTDSFGRFPRSAPDGTSLPSLPPSSDGWRAAGGWVGLSCPRLPTDRPTSPSPLSGPH